MRIAVVDGQGGGIGRLLVEKLREDLGEGIEIMALGTNAVAASAMLRSGANECASGENAVVVSSFRVDIIVGSVAIIAANSFCGELTPRMAEAISASEAVKILLPINRHNITLAGVSDEPLPLQADHLVARVREVMRSKGVRN